VTIRELGYNAEPERATEELEATVNQYSHCEYVAPSARQRMMAP
jgi:hypothetical protein